MRLTGIHYYPLPLSLSPPSNLEVWYPAWSFMEDLGFWVPYNPLWLPLLTAHVTRIVESVFFNGYKWGVCCKFRKKMVQNVTEVQCEQIIDCFLISIPCCHSCISNFPPDNLLFGPHKTSNYPGVFYYKPEGYVFMSNMSTLIISSWPPGSNQNLYW